MPESVPVAESSPKPGERRPNEPRLMHLAGSRCFGGGGCLDSGILCQFGRTNGGLDGRDGLGRLLRLRLRDCGRSCDASCRSWAHGCRSIRRKSPSGQKDPHPNTKSSSNHCNQDRLQHLLRWRRHLLEDRWMISELLLQSGPGHHGKNSPPGVIRQTRNPRFASARYHALGLPLECARIIHQPIALSVRKACVFNRLGNPRNPHFGN